MSELEFIVKITGSYRGCEIEYNDSYEMYIIYHPRLIPCYRRRTIESCVALIDKLIEDGEFKE